jgi:hypothetical protein
VSLALVSVACLTGCLSRTVAEAVTPRVGPPVRTVALEFDLRGKYNVPEEDRPALLTSLAAALSRRGVTVVPAGAGVHLLSAAVEEYLPGMDGHREDFFELGIFQATWRLTDPSGANLGEYRAGGTTSVVLGREWGDVIQQVGDSLADFLLASS